MASSAWIAYQESAFEHERLGFDRIRKVLGDVVVKAWTNFTLFEQNGRMHEVDALLLTSYGLWVIELKHWQGHLVVDQGSIISRRRPNLPTTRESNPILRTRLKAQVLASLLRAAAGPLPTVYVSPVVVFTHPDARLAYQTGSESIPVLTVEGLKDLVTRPPIHHPNPASAYLSESRLSQILQLLSTLEFAKGHQVTRRAFSFNLVELIDEGEDYQDFLGEHVTVAHRRARIRLFFGRDSQSRDFAERRAEREFKILEGITHDGILAPLNLEPTPDGPALLYPYDVDALPLQAWLTDHDLTVQPLAERLELWRVLGEALRYAHQRKILHRTLAPRNILAKHKGDRIVEFRVTNWHTGRSETLRGATKHLSDLVDEDMLVYLAPELSADPDVQTTLLDMYSLGALGYLLLTGQAPPPEGLALPQGTPPELVLILERLTQVEPTRRMSSADEFLECLDSYLVSNLPIVGAEALHNWQIMQNLGHGSSSYVYMVRHSHSGVEGVLKVARDARYDEAINAEAQILSRLNWKGIVKLLGQLDWNGRAAIVTTRAGDMDLARHLSASGPFREGALRDLGLSLLELALRLAREHLYYCDWKPANLGITRANSEIELFDFSLATYSAPSSRLGTPGYRDPLLVAGGTWNWAAERYAVAATLCELATTELPTYSSLRRPVTLPGLLRGHRLEGFFLKAFATMAEERYRNLEEMREHWVEAFVPLPEPAPLVSDLQPTASLREGRKYRVLSVPGPIAWAIFHAGQDVFNADHSTNHRGKILIHARSKECTADELDEMRHEIKESSGMNLASIPRKYPVSTIIGIVEVTNVTKRSRSIWALDGCHHWVLRDATLLDSPVRGIRGGTGLWQWTAPPL